MFRVSEVAETLKLSQTSIYDLISNGKLVAHRFGGALRVSEEDLQAYIDACREEKGVSSYLSQVDLPKLP